MDFEELALKGVDPSLGPSIANPGKRLGNVPQGDHEGRQRPPEVRSFLDWLD